MSRRDERERRKEEQREKQRLRQAKHAIEPAPHKEAKHIDPIDWSKQTVRWEFGRFDRYDWRKHPSDAHAAFLEVADHLKSYSQRTWGDISTTHQHDHAVEASGLCEAARKRLVALRLDDVDEVLRFRFSGAMRLWGFKQNEYFMVHWGDPDHLVCPSSKE